MKVMKNRKGKCKSCLNNKNSVPEERYLGKHKFHADILSRNLIRKEEINVVLS